MADHRAPDARPDQPLRGPHLLSRHEHRDLYATSPTFHHQVDALAAMLPDMLAGLAARAREEDAAHQARVEAARMQPVGPFLLDGDRIGSAQRV